MDTDLYDRLRFPLPWRWHRDRKLPGGDKYVYIPWHCYVDWLDEHAPNQWETSNTTVTVAGEWLSVTRNLSIGGKTRSGIGTCLAIPERNEEGKSKIIGDPHKNSFRSALVDACYHFGIAKHLDWQEATFMWALGKTKEGKKATNSERLSAAKTIFGVSPDTIREILMECFSQSANDIPPSDFEDFLSLLEAKLFSMRFN